MNILDNLENRSASTLSLPRNMQRTTVTTQELDALVRVARAANALTQITSTSPRLRREVELEDALQQLRDIKHGALDN